MFPKKKSWNNLLNYIQCTHFETSQRSPYPNHFSKTSMSLWVLNHIFAASRRQYTGSNIFDRNRAWVLNSRSSTAHSTVSTDRGHLATHGHGPLHVPCLTGTARLLRFNLLSITRINHAVVVPSIHSFIHSLIAGVSLQQYFMRLSPAFWTVVDRRQ